MVRLILVNEGQNKKKKTKLHCFSDDMPGGSAQVAAARKNGKSLFQKKTRIDDGYKRVISVRAHYKLVLIKFMS